MERKKWMGKILRMAWGRGDRYKYGELGLRVLMGWEGRGWASCFDRLDGICGSCQELLGGFFFVFLDIRVWGISQVGKEKGERQYEWDVSFFFLFSFNLQCEMAFSFILVRSNWEERGSLVRQLQWRRVRGGRESDEVAVVDGRREHEFADFFFFFFQE